MTSHRVESPLVPRASASWVRSLSTASLISGYRETYGFDASEYFRGLDQIDVYECDATRYRFYYPLTLTGKEELYRHLQQFDWNYKEDKWEYRKALNFVPRGSSILDVGCGRGAFVKMALSQGLHARGIELNASAASFARQNSLAVST